MFLMQGLNIAMILWSNTKWISACSNVEVNKLKGKQIGHSLGNQPFYFKQSNTAIVFSQTPKTKLLQLENIQIKEISIMYTTDCSELVPVLFTSIHESSENETLMIPASEVPGLIYMTHQNCKVSLLSNISASQLYLSWTRQVNDFTLYHFYGQLFVIQAGIKQLREYNKDRYESNSEILNFLYYAIQNQKRRLDQVSIYLPAMIERNSKEIVEKGGHIHDDEPYRRIQNGLLIISSKIKQNLSEIEGTLSPAFPHLIPKPQIDELINKQEKRGYIESSLATAAGLMFIGTPMLIGSAFMAWRTYASKQDTLRKIEMDAQLDNNRLEFYITKALEIFDHMMMVLIPFYVSETYRILVSGFKDIAITYKTALQNPQIADDLFKEISRLYTFKQLPIDDSVVVKKKTLIDSIHGSTEATEKNIQLFINEVNYDVGKYIETK